MTNQHIRIKYLYFCIDDATVSSWEQAREHMYQNLSPDERMLIDDVIYARMMGHPEICEIPLEKWEKYLGVSITIENND